MQSGCQDRLIPLKNQTTHQPLVLALTTTEQSLTFAHRFKKKLLTGPVLGEAYTQTLPAMPRDSLDLLTKLDDKDN